MKRRVLGTIVVIGLVALATFAGKGLEAPRAESKQKLDKDEVKLQIKSFMAGDLPAIRIHDISPPVDLPQGDAFWLGLAGGLAVLGLAGGASYWHYRRIAPRANGRPLSADELALQKLDELLAEGVLEKGDTREFYQRVTDVLRRYFEGRFGLRAPEWTTREFLAAVRLDLRLDPRQRQFLEEFFVHCDLVKFAEHQPTPEDIRNIFECCKLFIEETRHAV